MNISGTSQLNDVFKFCVCCNIISKEHFPFFTSNKGLSFPITESVLPFNFRVANLDKGHGLVYHCLEYPRTR